MPAAAGAAESDAGARKAIESKLASDRVVRTAGIEVAVVGGIAMLSGTVPVSPWSTRAARIARVVRGVRAVVNRIRVAPVRRSDTQVARDVRQALRGTAALARLPITVAVRRGVVLLTGSITTWDEQELAERVATSVPGVRFCQNQLSWRSSGRTAALVVADIQSRLSWDPYVEAAPIRVAARGGRVILEGAVGSAAQRKRAMAHAWVPGVTAVDAGGLSVVALPDEALRSRWPSDAEILSAIRDLSPYWPELVISGSTITVVGGVVTVRGTVATLAARDAAREMLRSAVGVVAVRDELRGPWWRPPLPPPPAPAKPAPGRRKRRSRS
jgi:hyperosmotically inducible protein